MAAGVLWLRGSWFRNFPPSLALRGMEESRVVRRRRSSCRSSSSSGLYYLIVGLGNHSMPETRHSIGMTAVDHLADKLGVKFQYDKKYSGYYGVTQVDGLDVILLKSKLVMNISGRSVGKVASAYQIQPSNVILIHDDLDKILGKYCIKQGGSARGYLPVFSLHNHLFDKKLLNNPEANKNLWHTGGHNGVKSVIGSLMACEMERFLIGIGRPKNKSEVISYVLQKFTATEKEVVQNIVEECCEAILEHLRNGVTNKTVSAKTVSAKPENNGRKKGKKNSDKS